MIVLDANYILRYLLQDHEVMSQEAKEVIVNEYCFLLNEVLAEVIYVLGGVYKIPKVVIAETLLVFVQFENMKMHEPKSIIIEALTLYKELNLDFVDCCLCAMKDHFEVKSFDKKLMKCVNR